MSVFLSCPSWLGRFPQATTYDPENETHWRFLAPCLRRIEKTSPILTYTYISYTYTYTCKYTHAYMYTYAYTYHTYAYAYKYIYTGACTYT